MGNDDKQQEPCPSCGGTGCPVCKGTGVASERVGRWGRGHREENGEQSGPAGGTSSGARSSWRRALVVVVGFAALGTLLYPVGVLDGPLSGLGLGFVVGVAVLGLVRLLR